MNEKRLTMENQGVDRDRCTGKTNGINRKQGGRQHQDLVDRMGAMRSQPVHFLDAVMNSVELPEEGHGMEGAVGQVKACIRDNNDFDRLKPYWLCLHDTT